MSGGVEELDDVIATQDAEGPTLVMRTKKRKLGQVADEPEGLVEKRRAVDGCAIEEEVVVSQSTSSEVAVAKKKTKLSSKPATKSAAQKSLPKSDPQKPKARRKIIPLVSGQQKLSNFFKS